MQCTKTIEKSRLKPIQQTAIATTRVHRQRTGVDGGAAFSVQQFLQCDQLLQRFNHADFFGQQRFAGESLRKKRLKNMQKRREND